MILPTVVPDKFSDLVELEEVDGDTIRIKDKKTGAVLQTVTRSQVEQVMPQGALPANPNVVQ